MNQLDCGDNSCAFAKTKTGMRTNGGCRCFSNAGFSRSVIQSAHEMLPELLQLRSELSQLKEERDAYEAVLIKIMKGRVNEVHHGFCKEVLSKYEKRS